MLAVPLYLSYTHECNFCKEVNTHIYQNCFFKKGNVSILLPSGLQEIKDVGTHHLLPADLWREGRHLTLTDTCSMGISSRAHSDILALYNLCSESSPSHNLTINCNCMSTGALSISSSVKSETRVTYLYSYVICRSISSGLPIVIVAY